MVVPQPPPPAQRRGPRSRAGTPPWSLKSAPEMVARVGANGVGAAAIMDGPVRALHEHPYLSAPLRGPHSLGL
jgi:hypothetical protein